MPSSPPAVTGEYLLQGPARVGVQPLHHGLRVAPGARRHLRGATPLSNGVEGESALAGARMRRVQSQPPQVVRCLTPAGTVNP
jgi:hypothetical protein